MRSVATLSRTGIALVDAGRDVRGAWGRAQTAFAAAAVLAALVPLFVRDSASLAALAGTLYLAVAAVGLAVPVGLAGMPLLAQGAFVGVGAAVAGIARADAGASPVAAAVLGALVAAAAGGLVGAGIARLRPALVAASTWIVAWLVYFALIEFPGLSGGVEGLVVPGTDLLGVELDAAAHFELALTLLVLVALAFGAISRGLPGAALAALRERPAAASALGVPSIRLRTAAVAASGCAGGLAGGFAVQLEGIADPSAYGPLLSFMLLVAVLLGGARTATGVIAGTLVVALVFWGAERLAGLADVATGRLDSLFAGILLLALLAVEGETLLPALADRLRREPPRLSLPAGPAAKVPPARLRAEGLTKAFGGDVAVDGVDLALRGGTIIALVGPNGSGKTTVLRLLAGTLNPDAGRVFLDDEELPPGGQRDRALRGIVRTLQATSVLPSRTVLENVVTGAGLRAQHAGVARTALATPQARRWARERRAAALATLVEVGLERSADTPVARLRAGELRLVMLAAALATEPRVVLLDEPSAGAGAEELEHVAAVLHRLRDRGLGVLVVEHNLGLVRRVADRIVVLDAGRVIAAGRPDEVAGDPAVRAAYLGRRRL